MPDFVDASAAPSPAPASSPAPVVPAPSSGPAPSTPGTAPAPPPTAPLPPFHTHPRFRELVTENRTMKGTIQELQTRLTQLESTATATGTLTAEERQQYTEAATALKRIFAMDPDLKMLLESRDYLPRLAEGYQSVQQLTAAQARNQQTAAKSHIARLAQEEGLPTDPKWVAHLVRLVAGAAMGLPDGDQRYDQGDLSVLDEAFTAVKGDFITALRQAGAASLTQSKGKVKTLPPAPRGTSAGEPAPLKVEPGKAREFARGMHQRGLSLLKERLSGE